MLSFISFLLFFLGVGGEIYESSSQQYLWCEEDGMVTFTVTSDGTTGPQWIGRLQAKGIPVSEGAQLALLSDNFSPTVGITTEVVVVKEVFADEDRVTKNFGVWARENNLVSPSPEVACLIREKFTDKEIARMGVSSISVFHRPIKFFPTMDFLTVTEGGLDYFGGGPVGWWSGGWGIAFAVR